MKSALVLVVSLAMGVVFGFTFGSSSREQCCRTGDLDPACCAESVVEYVNAHRAKTHTMRHRCHVLEELRAANLPSTNYDDITSAHPRGLAVRAWELKPAPGRARR